MLRCPAFYAGMLDNSRLGTIGFDGDLFAAGKRAENAGVRSLMSSRKE